MQDKEPGPMMSPSDLQLAYYTQTAPLYESQHGTAREHETALKIMGAIMSEFGLKTVLDVGAGTGRGVRYFLDHGFDARGIEPVPAMIEQAIAVRSVPPERLQCGSGQALPFPDQSFDVACATGILHHVADPDRIVREMVRVARRAVFFSDENRFGVGSWPSKLFAFSLHRLKLSKLYTFVRTKGKMYRIDSEDGLRYSYSLYESLPIVARWADSVLLLPTKPVKSSSHFQPLFTSSHLLLCGIRT